MFYSSPHMSVVARDSQSLPQSQIPRLPPASYRVGEKTLSPRYQAEMIIAKGL